MDERRKWAFWAFAAAALLITCIPSTILLDALQRYGRFLSGFEPGTLRPIRVRFIPHRNGRRAAPFEPKLQFVEFRLRAPRAKKVQLIGDFNGWREGTLALTREPKGDWELMLPLPSGRHHYLFVVDGKPGADPKNRQSETVSGRDVSVKVVP